jgi:hypothetical protein
MLADLLVTSATDSRIIPFQKHDEKVKLPFFRSMAANGHLTGRGALG